MTIRQLKEALDKVCANQDQEVKLIDDEAMEYAFKLEDTLCDISKVERTNNTLVIYRKQN